MEIGLDEPKVPKKAKLITLQAYQSHKSQKTKHKKINSPFVFTLEGIHGQIECLGEGEEEKQTRNCTELRKITKQHSIQIGPENASTFVALMHFVAQYG